MESEDDEDIDVFVSPRRFGGSTPSAKKAFAMTFEAEKAEDLQRAASKDSSFHSEPDIDVEVSLAKAHNARIRDAIVSAQERNQKRLKTLHYFVLACAGLLGIVSAWAYILGRSSQSSGDEISKLFASGSKLFTSLQVYAFALGSVSTLLCFAGIMGVQMLSHTASAGLFEDGKTAAAATYLLALLVSVPILFFLTLEAITTMAAVKAANNRHAKELLGAVITASGVSILTTLVAVVASSLGGVLGQQKYIT